VETQQTQRIRQRLYKKQSMLATTLRTLRAIHDLFDSTKDRERDIQRMLDKLNGLKFKYESHCASANRLLRVADGTMTLVSAKNILGHFSI
jgi:hypothetical protein